MIGLVIFIHVTICILLILIILIQAGRGGGLVESFSSVESMFGTKTSAFLTRATTVLSVSFFITCLSLAFLSAKQSRSLIGTVKIPNTAAEAPAGNAAAKELPKEKTPETPNVPIPVESPKAK